MVLFTTRPTTVVIVIINIVSFVVVTRPIVISIYCS